MKKTILFLSLVTVLAACGTSTQEAAIDSTVVSDTVVVDSLAVKADSLHTDAKEAKKAE